MTEEIVKRYDIQRFEKYTGLGENYALYLVRPAAA